ncbi:unnamed protein product [Leptosia nina]|uniref:UDP-glycosyltransferases domain-containing protein n=1 Tax=Leptosia nina TaxID=320188 RepID=A0AAV1K7J9_9NEOP
MIIFKIFLFLLYFTYSNAANILILLPYSAKSHYYSLRPIGLELARRGHNVTVITANKETDYPPTYHQVMVEDTKIWEVLGGGRPNVFSITELSAEQFYQKYIWPGSLILVENALKSPEVQAFLARDGKFDLVIGEQFMQEAFNWATETFELLDVENPTSFFGRLRNMYFSIYEYVWWRFSFLEEQEELVRKYIPGLPEPVPSLYDIQRNTSLMLVNSHFSVDTPMAYLPNIIEIGGIHLTKSDKSLPKDLQDYLDGADYGVVYINFGSNVRSTDLSNDKKTAFINVFKRLKQRVLFKWEEDELVGKPDNVLISKWLPQKEILAHPKIKVFISHGGLIGTQEAVYNGVPVIGIPVFSDQLNNILLLQDMGIGKLLKYKDISEERLYTLLREVLDDEGYRTKAKEISRRFKDRPMNALDTAIFWLEYIIRNNGASYMKSPAMELSWLAYTMLDMIFKISVFLFCLTFSYAANILYVIPFSTKSHYYSLRPIGLELARRGHNVTVITTNKETDYPPTYHQVTVENTQFWPVSDGKKPNIFSMAELSAEQFYHNFIWSGSLQIVENALKSPEVQALLASKAKFDLVIGEQLTLEAFNVLAHKYNAPLALVTTFGNCMKHNFLTRNPLQWAIQTFELLGLEDPTSFFGRLRNMYFSIYEYVWWRFWFLERQEELVRKYIPDLPEPVPSLYDIQKNASLMLVNSHFSVDTSMAYLPNIVEIGGIHLSTSDKILPKDLQDYLDGAEYGVVYVNFGSNVQSTDLSYEKKQAFINVFKRLKQRVLFKWEDDDLVGKPDNVMIGKWLPQKEILAHPKIKVFISHGGLIGTQEAIYNGVPVIGIPVFADQFNNILLLQDMGIGKLLKYKDISEERLYTLLRDVLDDEGYRTKAKEISRRFKDRPMNALDTAIFWLEYIIRNNGASYMKSPAMELSWLAYTMLDAVLPFFLFLYVVYPFCSDAANILLVIPFTTKSHYINLKPIGFELARRGHNVTVITPYREKEYPPNYHQVMVKDTKIWDALGTERPNVFTMVDLNAEEFHNKIIWPGGLALTEEALKSTEVQDLLSSNAKFDLIINEQFFQEAFYALAVKYNAPLALVITHGNCMKHNFVTRNPLQWATITHELLNLHHPTSFLGRLRNMYFSLYELFWWKFWFLIKQEELMYKHIPGLPDPMPSLYEVQKNASLLLVNSHFSVDSPIAYLPNIIEIGGIHVVNSNKSLPQDLQGHLDDAVHGVVYVNFGSNVRSCELSQEKKQAFIKVFKRLKQTIIWKWEDDKLEDKPKNVIIRKWLPQNEILAHPNVKVFISHGGLIGTQEAIYHGVPVISVPIYGDQLNNVLTLENLGVGKLLSYHNITETNLYSLISEMLTNPSYMKKAKEVAKRFVDRPMNALDTAVFWLEYVIRHNGADHMKNPAIELNWFSYTMLDVYTFVLFVLMIVLYMILMFLRFLFCNRNTMKMKKA